MADLQRAFLGPYKIDLERILDYLEARTRHLDEAEQIAVLQQCSTATALEFEQRLRTRVNEARKIPLSWQQIGAALDTTRQAAHQRYASPGSDDE